LDPADIVGFPPNVAEDNYSIYARAYAVTPLPCAAACTPFKSSPATYATCCKQHAANAPKSKPAAKPATKTYPLTYKPLSTGALQQGQVKRVVDLLPGTGGIDTFKGMRDPPPTRPQNITTTTTPSGGGSGGVDRSGCGSEDLNDVSHHTSGCGDNPECNRVQVGIANRSGNCDLRIKLKVPSDFKDKDSATLQIGGGQHKDPCKDVRGYKLYFGINGGMTDIGTEYGSCGSKHYGYFNLGLPDAGLRPNGTYILRATKQDLGPGAGVLLTMYLNGKQWGQVKDTGQLGNGTPFYGRLGDAGPIDQLRIDNWTKTEPLKHPTKYACVMTGSYKA
jgi:hypothetical protein